MRQWTKEMEIDAPIERVWKLFDGSLENMRKIMPQVVEHQPVKITEEGVGSVYRQKYKEGKRIAEYDVETLEYLDAPKQKKLKVGFTLAGMFEITAAYELNQIHGSKTLFRYSVTNRPLKWFAKLFLLLAGEKAVIQFVERVKRVAESESDQ
ncbi:MAG: hypothetical protein BAA01_10335 [Bacillus thermozeamaize]|uniref:Polyketide cyclase n=1 Tax=Bacillus thermozeamaize TaxID=230954 RepID=A0A1Y3PDY0_9BACI|nr:MAG: hypothetical protein BAA01_10335 [Bacillus thermozeamaize]